MQKYKLHHIFYNFDTGGAQKRLGDFIEYTSDIFDHYITALNGDYSHLYKNNLNAQIHHIPYQKGYLLKNILTIRQSIKKLNPHCVLTHNFGSFEAVIANTPQIMPHIHNEDGFGTDESETLKWKRNLLRKVFLMGKTTIVPSTTLESIALKYWKTYNHNIDYIPNGVPKFTHYPNCPFDNQGRFTIGTVAICRPEKNLKQFIDLIAMLKNQEQAVFGVLVGDGAELETLENYAQEKSLTESDILFTGFQTDYRAFMAYFDLFAMTSLTEQQPFSILDAMACGLPIISTDVGDVKKMVSDFNHPFISHNIFLNHNNQLIDLINNAPYRAKIAQANLKQYQENFQLSDALNKRKNIILSKVLQ
jgi:glycosyltransferase involved in cell wall biosynthesis